MTAPVSRRRFRRAVRRLDATELAAFVADLRAAGGETTTRDGRRVTVHGADGDRTVVAHDGTGPFGRGRLTTPPDPDDVDADRVATTVDDPEALDPAALYRAALYGLAPAAADRCCRRHLGFPARTDTTAAGPTVPTPAVAVVLLVCAIVVGTALSGTGAPGAEPSVETPADVRDSRAVSPDPSPLTPAVLGRAHAASLRDTGFAFRTVRTVREPGGAVRSRVLTVGCVSPDRRVVSAAVTVEGPEAVLFAAGLRNATAAFYGANGTLVRATAADGRTAVDRVPDDAYDASARFFLLPDPRAPAETFRGVELRPTRTEEVGIQRVRGDLLANGTRFARSRGVTAPRNLSAAAVVDDAGTVRRSALSYDATFVDERISVTRRASVRRVSTTPTRPSWANETGGTTASGPDLRRETVAGCPPRG